MGLTSPGIGTGLFDPQKMAESMAKAETAPAQNRHDRLLASANTQISALGQLTSVLSKLQTSLTKLADLSQLYTLKNSISDSDYLSATVGTGASAGVYQIEIEQMAKQQSLSSVAFTNSATTVGSGTITIDFGTYSVGNTVFTANPSASSVTVTIAPGTDTVEAIKNAINNKKAGVTASIVQDSGGSKLLLTSVNTGEDYAMKITVTDDDGTPTNASGLSRLAYDPTASVNSLTQTVEAKNSRVKINGLTLNQNSNTLKDALTGITLNLKKEEDGKIITLTVDDNKDQLTSLVNDFVKQYNESMSILNAASAYNKETKQGALFNGDPMVRNLKLGLSKSSTGEVANIDPVLNSLARLGIKSNQNNGLLEIDKEKFNKIVADNYKDIGAIFAKTDTSTGIATPLKTLLTTYLGTTGGFTLKTQGLNKQVKDLEKIQSQIDLRADNVRRRYFKQFSELDRLLAGMQNTSNALSQQIASLNR